jgi:hypothetical protein
MWLPIETTAFSATATVLPATATVFWATGRVASTLDVPDAVKGVFRNLPYLKFRFLLVHFAVIFYCQIRFARGESYRKNISVKSEI